MATHVRHAKVVFNWLVAEEVITRSPFARLSVSVPEEAKRTPEQSAIDAVIDAAKTKRDKALLTLLADTGARKGEVASLLLEDIDMAHAMLFIRESKTRRRPVPMSPRLVAAMGRWLRVRGRGGPWLVVGLQESLRVDRAGGRAGQREHA